MRDLLKEFITVIVREEETHLVVGVFEDSTNSFHQGGAFLMEVAGEGFVALLGTPG